MKIIGYKFDIWRGQGIRYGWLFGWEADMCWSKFELGTAEKDDVFLKGEFEWG